jgi:hypothetical protein
MVVGQNRTKMILIDTLMMKIVTVFLLSNQTIVEVNKRDVQCSRQGQSLID